MVVETISIYTAQRLHEIFNNTGKTEKKDQDSPGRVIMIWKRQQEWKKQKAQRFIVIKEIKTSGMVPFKMITE